MPHEQYTLMLLHEYVDSDGKVVQLDLPIKAQYVLAPVDGTYVPRVVLINEMLEKMSQYILNNVDCVEG